jgi:hypothetical protein
MIQPKLFAQLGNQCFMISAAIAHALKMGTTYSIPKKTISPNTWRTYFSHLPETKSATLHYYKEQRHCYDPLPEIDSLTIEGYFQSEQYFRAYKKEVAEALGFVHKPVDYVAVHIRRGDYLKYPDQFPVMPVEYYNDAINYFTNNDQRHFKFYSDDIKWCQHHFPIIKFPRVNTFEFSHDKDPLSDMKDMYNASGYILANSTFGLFPALLRPDSPIVIAPAEDRWFGPAAKHLETCDLMPERFIKM